MQKVVVLYKEKSDSFINYKKLDEALNDGWKVISSENVLSASNMSSQYSTSSHFNYTSEIAYILEKE